MGIRGQRIVIGCSAVKVVILRAVLQRWIVRIRVGGGIVGIKVAVLAVAVALVVGVAVTVIVIVVAIIIVVVVAIRVDEPVVGVRTTWRLVITLQKHKRKHEEVKYQKNQSSTCSTASSHDKIMMNSTVRHIV